MENLDLGPLLRSLREGRGLALAGAARRAGVSKSSLSAWESGQSRPRGGALARLLDALGAEPRLRARLLHAADPAFARVELASTPLGAPVDVGAVVRAMRVRRGLTQADLARAVGVNQSSVARWEAGEDAPGAPVLRRACRALGADAGDLAALATVQGEPLGTMPDDLEAAGRYVERLKSVTIQDIDEVVSLGLEAELWRRSVRDSRWDVLYCHVVGRRAHDLFCQGRLDGVEETARRALRRATTPEARVGASAAVGALIHVARRRGDPPGALLGQLTAWADRVPESNERSWMVWERSRLLARLGREAEAMDETERAVETLWRVLDGRSSDVEIEYNAAKYRVETLLETDRPERALAACPQPGSEQGGELAKMIWIPAWHAADEPAPAAWLATVRAWVRGGLGDSWINRERLTRMEREQARLLARP